MTLNNHQERALMALRIAIGLLLFWWGLAKIVNPGIGVGISRAFYFDLFNNRDLQFWFGFAELTLGAFVAAGFLRRITLPLQLVVTGWTSLMVWNALLDPFALYLPVDRIVGFQHLFYPSLIILVGTVVLMLFREEDRLSLDRLLQRPDRARRHSDELAA